MQQSVSKSASVVLSGMTESHVDGTNKSLQNIHDLLVRLGYGAETGALAQALPRLLNAGVQGAANGVIQDPAGTAIGSGRFPAGGGGSGAIYAKFVDLQPVPAINPCEAVFNESEQDGGRVLHSYSPHLQGAPDKLADCCAALQALANSYLNALQAERLLPPPPGTAEVFTEFGAVPLAGRIFARKFKNDALNHLHPGYTIASLLIAQAEMIRAGKTVPRISIYYFDRPVYQAAESVIKELTADFPG